MPDKKPTDREIVKALECCCGGLTSDWCDKCPMNVTKECDKDLLALEKLALDLINRQKAEIDSLYKTINDMASSVGKINEKLPRMKAETYKEFAERLHEELRMYGIKDKFNKAVFLNVVDKAKNELVGEE